VLQQRATEVTFDALFRDWVVANALNDRGLAGGRYVNPALDDRPAVTPLDKGWPVTVTDSVSQYGADYRELLTIPGRMTLVFTGTQEVALVGPQAHSGSAFWWGNRGDSMDTTLTRSVDLAHLSEATLSYWLWYDIEEGWDYAYVEASVDGGVHWTTLAGSHTTDKDPVGQNYGRAYTGESGGWIRDQVDLTPYAGRQVLLRFEYVTDDAVNNPGVALDDICLVQTGTCDNAEADGDWQSAGFARVIANLPQRYAVQVVETGGSFKLSQVPLDGLNQGQLAVGGPGVQRVLVIVSGLTPVTTERAPFTYTLR
jgi:immune inhibitor A